MSPTSPRACYQDVNSWKHRVVWALVKNGRISSIGRERPDLGRVERWHSKVVKLESLIGRLERLGLDDKNSQREAKRTRSRMYRCLKGYSQWLANKIVRKALKHKSKVVIERALEESWRDLLEEGLTKRKAKIRMAGVRRFIRILETQLKWHGMPYEFKRLPSRVCPECEVGMEELPGRRMRCPSCGLGEDRDKIPILWALRLAWGVARPPPH